MDADGTKQSCNRYTVVKNTDNFHFTTGWYVVNSNVTLTDDNGVFAEGDVHLILCDNATLTVDAGIIGSDDSSLTIYAQSTGSNMGKLIATGNACGIRGSSVTINGGTIKATGETGILADGATISGGEVEITGAGYCGIVCSQTITIKSGIITVIGPEKAIEGNVINAIKGTGWTNAAGTAGKADIAVSTQGRTLDYKKHSSRKPWQRSRPRRPPTP